MLISLDSIIFLIAVAFIWGITNPFIKKGAKGLENVKSFSKFGQFYEEFAFLITNLKYLVPFIINQSGSILYFLTLNKTDISLAIPVTNSLTFMVTAMTGSILGEEKIHKNTYIGMILILIGTILCCWDKVHNIEQF
ncbi:transmembrane protein [Apis mellifera caucasica]|uniref:Transmembrane protein 234 homolog n=1 Tax=Apis mellifera TaxID=7460 RepID=A0A7M7L5K6_APIME|nr:transmembrane protein 234 homolog [Apis mellifera]KAG6802279.1 transmembrane protein [Apis mellifera caucasica]KAG9436990.1 transmembrane protein [Apis mellifera carnica]|eukprot:XP_026297025.1 transmembrane protein 234 homolog [Apis mellifera]